MDKVTVSFTVFFENPFWVGVFERSVSYKGEMLVTAAKITFGAQPSDAQVYEYLLEHYRNLRFSPPVSTKLKTAVKNPKRLQREIHRAVKSSGMGTKSQQALALMREENHKAALLRKREMRKLQRER